MLVVNRSIFAKCVNPPQTYPEKQSDQDLHCSLFQCNLAIPMQFPNYNISCLILSGPRQKISKFAVMWYNRIQDFISLYFYHL